MTHCIAINKMLKIRALNRESSSDEDVPIIRREAQVIFRKNLKKIYLVKKDVEF